MGTSDPLFCYCLTIDLPEVNLRRFGGIEVLAAKLLQEWQERDDVCWMEPTSSRRGFSGHFLQLAPQSTLSRWTDVGFAYLTCGGVMVLDADGS